jgi:uncharacterized membrane protein YqaE (UPF0057 family)
MPSSGDGKGEKLTAALEDGTRAAAHAGENIQAGAAAASDKLHAGAAAANQKIQEGTAQVKKITNKIAENEQVRAVASSVKEGAISAGSTLAEGASTAGSAIASGASSVGSTVYSGVTEGGSALASAATEGASKAKDMAVDVVEHLPSRGPLAGISNRPALFVLLAICAFCMPPLAVFLLSGCTFQIVLNVVLCMFCWIPGIIHAFCLLIQDSRNKR